MEEIDNMQESDGMAIIEKAESETVKEVKKMWAIFILVFLVSIPGAAVVLTLAAWIIHKVRNAMLREDKELEKGEKQDRGE